MCQFSPKYSLVQWMLKKIVEREKEVLMLSMLSPGGSWLQKCWLWCFGSINFNISERFSIKRRGSYGSLERKEKPREPIETDRENGWILFSEAEHLQFQVEMSNIFTDDCKYVEFTITEDWGSAAGKYIECWHFLWTCSVALKSSIELEVIGYQIENSLCFDSQKKMNVVIKSRYLCPRPSMHDLPILGSTIFNCFANGLFPP